MLSLNKTIKFSINKIEVLIIKLMNIVQISFECYVVKDK